MLNVWVTTLQTGHNMKDLKGHSKEEKNMRPSSCNKDCVLTAHTKEVFHLLMEELNCTTAGFWHIL